MDWVTFYVVWLIVACILVTFDRGVASTIWAAIGLVPILCLGVYWTGYIVITSLLTFSAGGLIMAFIYSLGFFAFLGIIFMIIREFFGK